MPVQCVANVSTDWHVLMMMLSSAVLNTRPHRKTANEPLPCTPPRCKPCPPGTVRGQRRAKRVLQGSASSLTCSTFIRHQFDRRYGLGTASLPQHAQCGLVLQRLRASQARARFSNKTTRQAAARKVRTCSLQLGGVGFSSAPQGAAAALAAGLSLRFWLPCCGSKRRSLTANRLGMQHNGWK